MKKINSRGGPQKPSNSLVVRKQREVVPVSSDTNLLPGYRARPVVPAKHYDVVSFAKAMNDDFGPRLKKLFDPETEAAVEAQQTGVYIGWRVAGTQHDCQRVSRMSRCFCGHILGEHATYTGRSIMVPCRQPGCRCQGYAWIPSRVEEIGEFWHQRRRDFDPEAWRAKCRCKHTHEDHDPGGMRRCRARGCGCGVFDSSFACAACDKHWQEHETFFETETMRKENGLPYGADYLPFAEIPELRDLALTGVEDDSRYKAITGGTMDVPSESRPVGNNAPVDFSGKKSRFKPVYD